MTNSARQRKGGPIGPQYRAVFDAEVTFSNGGALQTQGFRVDLPSDVISEEEIGRLFVTSLDLLLEDGVYVHNVRIIEEAHKGTRGGPSDTGVR